MDRYNLPVGMRYSTLKEREEFYSSEFNLGRVAEWFGESSGKVKFAAIIGRHTKIYPEKYKEDASTTIIIDEYQTLKDLQEQILEFLPEAVYYDRNVYDQNNQKTGQQLAFDLDPENVVCPVHGTLDDKMKRNPGLGFCELELNLVKAEAIRLYEYLQKRFSDLRVVYSGRGFHIHVLDPEAYKLTAKQRLAVAEEIKKAGFPIDVWVSSGEMRLIRLPYSLNGLVSRIVLPLSKKELESFNPIKDERCLPKFLAE
jgi:DNA primase catalytic subunit